VTRTRTVSRRKASHLPHSWACLTASLGSVGVCWGMLAIAIFRGGGGMSLLPAVKGRFFCAGCCGIWYRERVREKSEFSFFRSFTQPLTWRGLVGMGSQEAWNFRNLSA